MSGLVSGCFDWRAFIGIEITGRLDSKSFESFKLDLEKLARRYGLRVRKLRLKGKTKRRTKKKK